MSLCQGSAAQTLGLLEALTDTNCRTLLSASPVPADSTDTELGDVYAELFSAAHEIICGQSSYLPSRSVLRRCWLGDRKRIRPVKKLDVGLLVVTI